MAQRRMIARSISTSTRMAEVSTFAKLLFTWIIPHCDDFGHLDSTPKILKGMVVPFCEEGTDQVEAALNELESNKLIRFYEVDGRRYLEIDKWNDHQTFKNDRKKVALYPAWNPDGSIVQPSEVKLSEVKLSEVNEAEKFFSSPILQEEMIETLVAKKIPEGLARSELTKFCLYWTEPNRFGNKMRWQAEKFFDVKRRLTTWFGKVREYQMQRSKSNKTADL